MKINIECNEPETNVLEICFYRGRTLLHNVFYDIEGLNDEEILALKRESVAKFCSVFPEISAKDVMKGFGAVDEKMYKLYKETFDNRGGARTNAGRKPGVKIGKIKPETIVYYRRVTKEEAEFLDKQLEIFKNNHSH